MKRHAWPLAIVLLGLAACAVPVPVPEAPTGESVRSRFGVAAVAPVAIVSVAVDSQAAGLPKERLVDGNLSTQWSNGGYRNATAWASATLATSVAIAGVALKTGPSAAGTSYDVQVSTDGVNWTTRLANQTNSGWSLETKTLPAGTSGRYVRIFWRNSATNPQAHFSIFELQVLSGASSSPAPSSAPSPTPTPVPSATTTPAPTPVPSGALYPAPSVAAPAYAARLSFLGSGLRGPNGLAIDANDTLYEADWFGNTVTRVTQAGATSNYASNFKGPAGLAFDPQGALLVAAYNGHTLEKIPPGGGSHSTFVGTGLNRPVWPAVNSRGDIFLADYSNNRIARITPTGQVSTFKSMSGVNAIDIDPQDNLWVCTWGGTVAKITPAGTTTTIATGLSTACAIAWCPSYLALGLYGGESTRSGRLLLLDFSGNRYTVATGLDRTSSVIFDSRGALYAANIGDSALRKYSLR